MKILYNSDPHGDLRALGIFSEFARERDIDLVVSSGDLIGGVFEKDELKTYKESANVIYAIRKANNLDAHPIKLAEYLMNDPNCPVKLRNTARTYLESLEKAQDSMSTQYKKINEILRSSEKPFLVSPGNHDGYVMDKIFPDSNIHQKVLQINGTKIAGYGSDKFRPTWIPQELLVDFDEEEAYQFLTQVDPEIAIIHVPPYGLCDLNEDNTHQGNFAMLAYMLESRPNLLLCGHIHESKGIESKDGDDITKVINPGNLGRFYINHNKGPKPGNFVEIETHKGYLKTAKNYRITDFDKGLESIIEESIIRPEA